MTTDADLHKTADQHKTDLTRGRGVQVDDGQGNAPPPKQDKFAARMAMFEKSDKMRAEGRARSGDDVVDTSGADTSGATEEDRTLHLNRAPQGAAPSPVGAPQTPPSQGANTRVTLDFNGGQIEVAQADIDHAGGKELYLRRRELDAEAIRMSSERATLEGERNAALAESNRLREELRAAKRTGQDGPAGSVVDPTTQHRNDAGAAGVDQDALAARLARQIYSGDEGDAQKAIAEILGLARAKGETLDADQIAERAAAMVRGTAPNAAPANAQPPRTVSPVVEATNQAINRMAQSEFADVCNDDVARQATFAQLQRMMKDPANRDRRAVDVARDACDWGRATFFNSRQGIVEQKRGLPSSVAASGAASQSGNEEPEVLTGSALIAAMAEHRNFGRRAK